MILLLEIGRTSASTLSCGNQSRMNLVCQFPALAFYIATHDVSQPHSQFICAAVTTCVCRRGFKSILSAQSQKTTYVHPESTGIPLTRELRRQTFPRPGTARIFSPGKRSTRARECIRRTRKTVEKQIYQLKMKSQVTHPKTCLPIRTCCSRQLPQIREAPP